MYHEWQQKPCAYIANACPVRKVILLLPKDKHIGKLCRNSRIYRKNPELLAIGADEIGPAEEEATGAGTEDEGTGTAEDAGPDGGADDEAGKDDDAAGATEEELRGGADVIGAPDEEEDGTPDEEPT